MRENVKQSRCEPHPSDGRGELRCKYCKYDTHEEVIKAAFWMDNGLIVIESIPARLCKGCGEQFLDEQITRRIQELLKNPTTEPERLIRVSVYDLPQLESMGKHRHPCQKQAGAEQIKDSQASLQCKYCESETVEELVKSAFWVDEQLIAVENIPARVCQECEVHFYDDETAETIATLGQCVIRRSVWRRTGRIDGLRAVPDGARRDVTASVFSLGDKENAADNRYHEDASDRLCE